MNKEKLVQLSFSTDDLDKIKFFQDRIQELVSNKEIPKCKFNVSIKE